MVLVLAPSDGVAAPQVFDDRAAFFAATGAAPATGPLPDLGAITGPDYPTGFATVGSVTFGAAPGGSGLHIGTKGLGYGISDWYPQTPGNDIALGYEHLLAQTSTRVYSLGFEMVEPNTTIPLWGGPGTDSPYRLALFDGPNAVDEVSFNAPDDQLAFVGVWSTVPFDRVVIEDTTGIHDDEYFGEFYSGTAAPPKPIPPEEIKPTPPPPAPPVARVIDASSKTLGRAAWLSAATSSVASGLRIKRYEWDFNADGRYEADCGGGSPAVSHAFQRAGKQLVGLRMTDSLDRVVATKQLVRVPVGAVNRLPKMASVFTCEDPVGPNQPNRSDCVKTFGFSIVSVNGRGDPDQCFEVTSRPRNESGEGMPYYRATIDGPVALNGLPIPLPKERTSEYDSGEGRIGLGRVPVVVTLPGGNRQVRAMVDLDTVVAPSAGRFRLAPLETSRGLKFAGLSLSGALDVTLVGYKTLSRSAAETRFSEIGVSVKLPNFLADLEGRPLQGTIRLRTSNTRGFELDQADFAVPAALFGPVAVSDLFFKYQREGELLRTGANFRFPGLGINASPPPDGRGFGLRGGKFDYAGLGIDFPPPGPQLFPGIGLTHLAGSFGVDPVRVTGEVGVNVAGVVAIDGSLFAALARPGQSYSIPAGLAPPGLEFLEGRRVDSFSVGVGGQASLIVPVLGRVPLNDAYAFYGHPGFFEFGGAFDFSAGLMRVRGGLNGWVAMNARPARFNLEGNVEGCIGFSVRIPVIGRLTPYVCREVNALVSTRGIGFCVGARLPILGRVAVGVGYRWGDSLPDVHVFSCDLGPYREARPARARAAQAAGRSFTLDDGLPSAQIRVTGRGGAPEVTLTGPGGEEIVTADGKTGNDYAIISRPEENTTYIALRKPAGGRYTVSTIQGSVPIGNVAAAEGLTRPEVRASVSGSGPKRILRYRISAEPGQSVTFAERGRQTYRVLGRARGTRGSIAFTAAEGPRGPRRIVALVERGGVTRYRLDVARFTASAGTPPARPRALRVRQRGGALAVSWRSVPGARQYGVSVQISNGERIFRLARRGRIRLGGINPQASGSVYVRALSATGNPGPPATRRFRARL